jgi:hypothetical protein
MEKQITYNGDTFIEAPNDEDCKGCYWSESGLSCSRPKYSTPFKSCSERGVIFLKVIPTSKLTTIKYKDDLYEVLPETMGCVGCCFQPSPCKRPEEDGNAFQNCSHAHVIYRKLDKPSELPKIVKANDGTEYEIVPKGVCKECEYPHPSGCFAESRDGLPQCRITGPYGAISFKRVRSDNKGVRHVLNNLETVVEVPRTLGLRCAKCAFNYDEDTSSCSRTHYMDDGHCTRDGKEIIFEAFGNSSKKFTQPQETTEEELPEVGRKFTLDDHIVTVVEEHSGCYNCCFSASQGCSLPDSIAVSCTDGYIFILDNTPGKLYNDEGELEDEDDDSPIEQRIFLTKSGRQVKSIKYEDCSTCCFIQKDGTCSRDDEGIDSCSEVQYKFIDEPMPTTTAEPAYWATPSTPGVISSSCPSKTVTTLIFKQEKKFSL